jgi:hypothetical protein
MKVKVRVTVGPPVCFGGHAVLVVLAFENRRPFLLLHLDEQGTATSGAAGWPSLSSPHASAVASSLSSAHCLRAYPYHCLRLPRRQNLAPLSLRTSTCIQASQIVESHTQTSTLATACTGSKFGPPSCSAWRPPL